MNSHSLGLYYYGAPIKSIGDTLGLTAVIKKLYEFSGEKVKVVTPLMELFENNPYVEIAPIDFNTTIKLSPCLQYDCNIIKHYAEQLNIEFTSDLIPELYLQNGEIEYAKKELVEFNSVKKIAVCLNASCMSRSLNYDFILPLLEKLKSDGYVLLLFGLITQNDEIFHRSYAGRTTLRQTISLMNECDFYLGVDTSLFHIMSALKKPQVVFFRNAGHYKNAYFNTYYSDSLISCGPNCKVIWLERCNSEQNCMENFNLEDYYKIITKLSI